MHENHPSIWFEAFQYGLAILALIALLLAPFKKGH